MADLTPKQARILLGLTQAKMAQAMGVPIRTWQLWEYGDRRPSRAAMQMIAALIWMHNHGKLDSFMESRAIII